MQFDTLNGDNTVGKDLNLDIVEHCDHLGLYYKMELMTLVFNTPPAEIRFKGKIESMDIKCYTA